jgi:glycine oxidase
MALSFKGDHQVDNRRLTAALAASCRARGVEFVENANVEGLALDDFGFVCGVHLGESIVYSDNVVVAAGAWASRILGFEVPVDPVKGEIIALDCDVRPFARVLRSEKCYLVSRVDGRVLVGATQKRTGFDMTISQESISYLLESARQLVPGLSEVPSAEAWAGLRPATPDGLPAVGYVDDHLIAAVGHFRNGILLAPMTGRLVAGLIEGRRDHPALEPLDPRRFFSQRH